MGFLVVNIATFVKKRARAQEGVVDETGRIEPHHAVGVLCCATHG